MNGLSKAYLNELNRKERKAVQDVNYVKKKKSLLYNGLKQIAEEYTKFLKKLRLKSEELYDPKELKPFSQEVRKIIEIWLSKHLDIITNNLKKKNDKDELENLSIPLLKMRCDEILHIGTCSTLLGISPSIIIKGISPFQLFSSYYEFFKEGLCHKIQKIDITSDNNDRKIVSVLEVSMRDKLKKEYSTLELIEDLKEELSKYPEILAKLFPERINKFKHRHLSILWGKSPTYVSKVLSKIKNKNPNFSFTDTGIKELEEKIQQKFKKKDKEALRIIIDYRKRKLSIDQLIYSLENELGRVSGDIQLNDYELGLILVANKKYFERLKSRITNPRDSDYNPNFKFSIEKLNNFEDDLFLLLEQKSTKSISFIKKYIRLNPDLKQYSGQQYTIENPDVFSELNDLEKLYWLGFMWADAYINEKTYRLSFELSVNDKERIEKFAKFIGLDSNRIKTRERILIYKGIPKLYKTVYVQPVCKPLVMRLKELGYTKYKAHRKNLPKFVIDLIKEAKSLDWSNWWHTSAGKKATTWLLGFYDGDGSYLGFNTARILSASNKLLHQIKEVYDISNNISTRIEPGDEVFAFDQKIISKGFYQLNLGNVLFTAMIKNYENSLRRKRP